MQSFSRSLMLHILTINKHLVSSRALLDSLQQVNLKKAPIGDEGEVHLTEGSLIQLQNAIKQINHLFKDTADRLSLLSMQEDNSNNKETALRSATKIIEGLQADLNNLSVLEVNSPQRLQNLIQDFESAINNALQQLLTSNATSSGTRHMRAQIVCERALTRAIEIRKA